MASITQITRNFFSHPRKTAIFYSLVAFLMLMAIWWFGNAWVETRLYENERNNVAARINTHGISLTYALERRLSLVGVLKNFVVAEKLAHPVILNREFEMLAEGLIETATGIRDIAIAPGGTVQYVFPREPNKAVIGYRPSDDPRAHIREDVRRAIETRRIVVSRPNELIQGGTGIIARQAVFINNKYWGLANVVVDIIPLLKEAGLFPNPKGISLALQDKDGVVFFGDSAVLSMKPVIYSVDLAEDPWKLAAAPAEGWVESYSDQLLFVRSLGLLVAILITLVVYLVVKRQERLAERVRQRTRELRESELRYRAIVDSEPECVKLLDRDCRILSMNRAGLAMLEIDSEDQVRGKSFLPFVAPEYREAYVAFNRRIFDGAEGSLEFAMTGTKGSRQWMDSHAVPLRDLAGNVIAALAVTRDMTSIKEAGKKLQAALEDSRRHRRELEALLDASRAVLTSTELFPLAKRIFALCKEHTGATAGCASLVNEDDAQEEFFFLDTGDETCSKSPELYMPLRGFARHVYETGKAAFVNDYRHSAWNVDPPAERIDLENVLFVPLEYGGKTVGLLGLANKPGNFTDADLRLAKAFGEMFSIALLNMRNLEALEQSELRYRSVVESANNAFISMDEEGRIMSWNRAAEEIFGYSREEAMNISIQELMPERFRQQHAAGMERLRTSGISKIIGTTVEMTGLRKDGTEFPLELSLSSWKGTDGRTFFTASVHDITERKKSEEALRASEERYRRLVEHSPDAIAVHSEGKIVFVNPAAVKLMGAHSEKDLIGKPVLDLVHPDHRSIIVRRIQHAMKTNSMLPPLEEKFIRLDGRVIDVEVASMPIMFKDKPAMQAIVRDISKRKLTEQALKESEERYQFLSEATSEGIILHHGGEIIDVNTKATELFGYTREELQTMNVLELTAPESREIALCRIEQGTEYRTEVTCIQKDGSTFIAEIIPRNQTYNSKPVRVVLVHDITERKKTEAALQESEEKYHALFQFSNDGIFLYDQEGSILDVNERAVKMTGYRRSELLSMNMSDLHPPSMMDISRKAFKTLQRTGMVRFEIAFRKKNGNVFPVEISSNLLDIHGRTVIQGMVRNIAAAKKAERALRESEQRYRILSEASPDAIYIINRDDTLEYVNTYAARLLHSTPDKLIGQKRSSFFPPPIAERQKREIDRVFQTGNGRLIENKSKFNDDNEMWQSTYLVPLKNEQGEVQAVLGVSRDITAAKQAERALRESEERFRIAFHTSPDSVNINRMEDGLYVDINEGFTETTGYTREDVIGKTSQEINIWNNPKDRDRLLAGLNEHGFVNNMEAEFRMKDGRIVTGLISARVIMLDNVPHILSITRDIEDLKKAERALRESEQRYRAFFQDDLTGDYISTVDGNLLECNPAFLHIFGFKSIEEALRTNINTLYSDPRERKRLLKEVTRNRKLTRRELAMKTIQGEDIIVEANMIGQFDERGDLQLLKGYLVDITRRRNAEEQLKRSNDELRRLSTHLQQIRERERASVARDIHDELGQALTAIKIDLAWMRKRTHSRLLQDKMEALVHVVDQTLQSMRRIVTELRPGILDDLGLEAALEWQAGEFTRRTGIACNLDINASTAGLSGEHATVLFRVFQEALTNTARHAGASSVTVGISQSGSNLVMEIRDNGKGINKQHINEPGRFGILGMQERVRSLGGIFHIRGRKGKGTWITVALPLTGTEGKDALTDDIGEPISTNRN